MIKPYHPWIILLLLFLPACRFFGPEATPPVGQPTLIVDAGSTEAPSEPATVEMTTTVVSANPTDTATAVPSDTATPIPPAAATATETATPVPPATATDTAVPTMTPTVPTSTPTAVPEPILITETSTNVRLGAGTTYGVAYVLPPGTTVPIIGKNLDSTWWVIPAAGRGQPGWVSAAVVSTQGDTDGVPIMAPPTLTPTPPLPIIGNSGPPPGDGTCIATHTALDNRGTVIARQGPGNSFPAVAELGLNRWARIIETRGNWHRIRDFTGASGWVARSHVSFSCPRSEPTPERIRFAPGAISATVEGVLHPPERDTYVFQAMAGQMTIIEIQSPDERANFMLSGASDGQPYKRLENEDRLWRATLPVSQDYYLTVAVPADDPATEYSLRLTIEPLDTVPTPSIGMDIDSFSATAVDLPDNGKRITFQWETHGGTAAVIRSGTAQRFQPAWDVPLSGEMAVDLAETLFRDPAMTLELYNAAGEFIAEAVIVDWACTNSYFFTPEPRPCPYPATAVNAVVQTFERGWMVWLENANGDNQREIIVLVNDGALYSFTDTWQEGDAVDDPALEPPPGLLQPVRGFGKVWRENPLVRGRLGWATAGEQPFQGTLQKQMTETLPSIGYLELLDGRILRLTLGIPVGEWEPIN